MQKQQKKQGLSQGIAFLDDWIQRLELAAKVKTPEPEDGSDLLMRFCKTLRAEFIRREMRKPGTLSHLANLKLATRDGAELMLAANEHGGSDFVGWSHGAKPQNELQVVMNAVSFGILDLTSGVMEIEARYPQLRARFEAERQARALEDQESMMLAHSSFAVEWQQTAAL